ncbi:signal peptidase I [Ferviditalea candida]|uniref:Signal peptidase I n=1 Tax=Ferviditalea candida TaxID=3108399 RepID=A0ABU5ZM32_9BACL|nr:signal peptidase I [Paenibacillaceae bacterium T2]
MEKQQDRYRIRKEFREWAVSIAAAVIIALLFQKYAFAQTEVRMNSMQNTLMQGQRLIENKFLYWFSEPRKGDIVIINGKESDKRLVKRIIGVSGDLIDIRDGSVFLNGHKVQESFVKGRTLNNGMQVPFRVPDHKVFVMGDNREASMDSRTLGPIDLKSIEGKVVFRIWPLSEFGAVE